LKRQIFHRSEFCATSSKEVAKRNICGQKVPEEFIFSKKGGKRILEKKV